MIGVGLSPTRVQSASSVPAAFAASTLYMDFTTGTYRGANAGQMTVTRASTAYADDNAGNWTSFPANVARITNKGLLIEEGRTNSIRNNSTQGAVAGTPGTYPTNWFIPTINAGISSQIVGTGTENGIDYIDVRFFGTNSGGALNNPVQFETGTGIAAVVGQTWTASVFLRLVAGSTTGLTVSSPVSLFHNERNSGGTFLTNGSVNAPLGTSTMVRTAFARATNQATTAFVQPQITLNIDASATIDVTIRIGWPQMELGAIATSPIRTTGGAVTRAADNISLTGTNFSSWYTGIGHTLYGEAVLDLGATADYPGIFAVDNGTASESALVYITNSTDRISGEVYAGGVAQNSSSTGVSAITRAVCKGAIAYATNDVAISGNGAAPVLDTVATMPSGVNTARPGQVRGGGNHANGYIRRVAHFPSRLTDHALSLLTSLDPTLDMEFTTGRYVGATPAQLTVTRASTGYAETVEGTLVSFGNNIPRITNKGLLVEESRTNLCIQSQDMLTGWAQSPGTSVVITGNQTTAPDGTLTADLYVPTSAANGHLLYRTFTGAISTTYTLSLYVKPASYTRISLVAENTGFLNTVHGALFELTGAGSVVSTVGSLYVANSATITALANGWYRVSCAVTTDADGGTYVVGFRCGSTAQLSSVGASFVGDDVNGCYVWGYQVEAGAFPTSYIPTTTIAVTRAADDIGLSGTNFSSWYTNPTAGTMYAEASTAGYTLDSLFPLAWSMDDGTSNNRIAAVQGSSLRGLWVSVTAAGVGPSSVTDTGVDFTPNVFAKVAGGYSGTTSSSSANGGTAGGATIASVPAVSRAWLGCASGGYFQWLNGYIRRVAYYPARLADTALSTLTITNPTLDMDFTSSQYVGATPTNLTVTRASTAYADDLNGVWTSFSSSVARITNKGLLVEEARTNSIRNNSMQGAVAGTPGTFPTNWGAGTNGSGAAWSVVGTGTESGIDYVDLRLSGTVTVGNEAFLYFDGTTAIAASNGQTWSDSAFVRIISETSGSLTSLTMGLASRIAGGGAGSWNPRGTNQVTNSRSATNITNNRVVFTGTISDASAAFVWPLLYFVPTIGALDVVVRVGWPQCELGAFATSPIRTTSAAVTRAADAVSLTGGNFTSWYGSPSAYTIFCAYTVAQNLTANGALFGITNVDASQRAVGFIPVGPSTVEPRIVNTLNESPGVTGVVVPHNSIGRYALAVGIGAGQGGFSLNGSTPTTSTVTALIGSPVAAWFGANPITGNPNGYIRRVRYYSVRLANINLQGITS